MSPLKEKTIAGEGSHKVLLVDIYGVISNQKQKSALGNQTDVGMVERVREILDKAEEDKGLKAMILRINTPGGTVTSSDIIFHEIMEFKNKRKIKVYAVIMDLATSGGYYIAQAADTIIAHPTSITGSIGVIAVKINANELMEKVGVDFEVVKSGEKKDFMSPFRGLSKEERRLFQNTIDSFHSRFVQTITDSRSNLNRSQVSVLADGRIYTAQEALKSGLIDRIAYMDEARDWIAGDQGVKDIKVVTYHRQGQYKNNIYSSLPSGPTVNLLNVNLNFLPQGTGTRFLYMWMP